MQEHRRVSTRVHTREIDRGVAKVQMKRIGIRRIASKGRSRTGSFFADHWREYCVGGKKKGE